VHEDFIGLHSFDTVTANEIVNTIKDVLLRMQINLSNCISPNYDGTSNISGKRSGMGRQIQEIETRAIYMYTHAYGHFLNLARQDSVKNCHVMKETLEITHEITKLIKKSLRRVVEAI
jgi:hypothetical protein